MESSRSDFLSKRRVWRLEPLALSKSRPIGHPGLDTDWEVNVDCCAMGARSIEPKERLRLFRRPRRRAARSLKNAILRKHPSATLQRVWSWRRRSSRIPSFFDHKPQDPDSLPKNRLCATANSCLIFLLHRTGQMSPPYFGANRGLNVLEGSEFGGMA